MPYWAKAENTAVKSEDFQKKWQRLWQIIKESQYFRYFRIIANHVKYRTFA